jgi:hypothetical protein
VGASEDRVGRDSFSDQVLEQKSKMPSAVYEKLMCETTHLTKLQTAFQERASENVGGALRAAMGRVGSVGIARRRRPPTFKQIQTAVGQSGTLTLPFSSHGLLRSYREWEKGIESSLTKGTLAT